MIPVSAALAKGMDRIESSLPRRRSFGHLSSVFQKLIVVSVLHSTLASLGGTEAESSLLPPVPRELEVPCRAHPRLPGDRKRELIASRELPDPSPLLSFVS